MRIIGIPRASPRRFFEFVARRAEKNRSAEWLHARHRSARCSEHEAYCSKVVGLLFLFSFLLHFSSIPFLGFFLLAFDASRDCSKRFVFLAIPIHSQGYNTRRCATGRNWGEWMRLKGPKVSVREFGKCRMLRFLLRKTYRMKYNIFCIDDIK